MAWPPFLCSWLSYPEGSDFSYELLTPLSYPLLQPLVTREGKRKPSDETFTSPIVLETRMAAAARGAVSLLSSPTPSLSGGQLVSGRSPVHPGAWHHALRRAGS